MKIKFRCPPELAGRLPKPYPAKRGLPDWLKGMPMSATALELEKDLPTVKQCPPFLDAMAFGFIMPLAADLRVENEIFDWEWGDEAIDGRIPASDLGWYSRSPISYHHNSQLTGTPLSDGKHAAIKFLSFWTIELPAGYSLLAMHPINRHDLPFRSLTGLVDCDRFTDDFVHFPALWIDHDFQGVLEKGTPVAQCVPVKREKLALQFDELVGESANRFVELRSEAKLDPHIYKNRYRVKKP